MLFFLILSNFFWNDNNNFCGLLVNMVLNGFRRIILNIYSSILIIGSKFFYGINSGGGIIVGSGVIFFMVNKGLIFGYRLLIGFWFLIFFQLEEDEDDDFLLFNFGDVDWKLVLFEMLEQVDGVVIFIFVFGIINNLDLFNFFVSFRGIIERIFILLFFFVMIFKVELLEQFGDGFGGLWGGNGFRFFEDVDWLRDISCIKRWWIVIEWS